MDDFSTPGTFNGYDVASSPSNYIEAGKMPMSSMSPSLVFDGSGRVAYVSGAAGGTRITTQTALVSLIRRFITINNNGCVLFLETGLHRCDTR